MSAGEPTPPGPRLTLLILNGGAARRMGRDKASIDTGGIALGARAARALRDLVGEVVVAGRPIPGLAARAVADAAEGSGPLAGVVAGLEAAAEEIVVVIAGDMPEVSAELVGLLVRRLVETPATGAVMCISGHGLEPLPMALRRADAPALRAAMERGVRALRDAAAEIRPLLLAPADWAAADPRGRSFENWNTPADIRPLPPY